MKIPDYGRRYGLPVALIITLVAMIGLIYAFRTEVEIGPDGTRFLQHYRWGTLAILEIDVEGDGGIDAKYLPSSDPIAIHPRFAAGWESSRCDRVLDIYWQHNKSGRLTVKYDSDRDGNYELRFEGEEATSFLKTLERPENCSILLPLAW